MWHKQLASVLGGGGGGGWISYGLRDEDTGNASVIDSFT